MRVVIAQTPVLWRKFVKSNGNHDTALKADLDSLIYKSKKGMAGGTCVMLSIRSRGEQQVSCIYNLKDPRGSGCGNSG
jgi:hypothetical protein